MNHEVEDDIHIERAGSEYAEPVNFKKHGLRDERRRGPDCRVKTLQVSDLADTIQTLSQPDQFVGFGERRGERLFNQHIDSGLHQGPGGFEMEERRDRDGGCLHLAVRGHQLFDGPESAATEFSGDGVGAGHVGIHHSYEADCFSLLRQLVIDACVVAPKGPHADHRHVNKVVSQSFNSPGSMDFPCDLCGFLCEFCGQRLLTAKDAKGTAEFAKVFHFAAFFRRAICPA